MGRKALCGIDRQTLLDKISCAEGNAAPVFERGEGVVGDEDRLHFFEVGFAVKGGVAAEEEVGYYAYGPDITLKR